MTSGPEASPGSQSGEHALSQQELGHKVLDLFNDFKQTFRGIPEFQEDLANEYFSPSSKMRDDKRRAVSFNRGLDKWVVRSFLEEENRTLLECLKVTVYGPIEHARGFRIVTLRMPYLADIANAKKDDVDISYDHRSLLIASSRTDIHHNNTVSAITNAEQMLVALKATP